MTTRQRLKRWWAIHMGKHPVTGVWMLPIHLQIYWHKKMGRL